MRYHGCGTVDTVSSYRRINREGEDGPKIEKSLKLGHRNVERLKSVRSLGVSSSRGSDDSQVDRPSSSKASPKERGESHPRKKVGIMDLLVGYQNLMQLSSSPITVQRKELYPTIGFIQHRVPEGENSSHLGK